MEIDRHVLSDKWKTVVSALTVAFSFFLTENISKLTGARLHWATSCGTLGKLNLAFSFSFPICKMVIPLITVLLMRVPTS